MYRPAFIAKHGMRSYKAVLGLLMPGARVNRPRYGHYFSDQGLVWGGIFSSLFVAVDKKGLAHLLTINCRVGNAFVCENLLSKNIFLTSGGQYSLMKIPINSNQQ